MNAAAVFGGGLWFKFGGLVYFGLCFEFACYGLLVCFIIGGVRVLLCYVWCWFGVVGLVGGSVVFVLGDSSVVFVFFQFGFWGGFV